MSVDFQIGIMIPLALLLCWVIVQIGKGKRFATIIKIFIDESK